MVSLTNGNPVFPAGHRLPGHEHFLGQLLLGKALSGSQLQDHIFGIHVIHLMYSIADGSGIRKQHAVAGNSENGSLSHIRLLHDAKCGRIVENEQEEPL